MLFFKSYFISGKIPVSIMEDLEWDVKSFPILDPKMENNMNRERKVRLSNLQYIEQRILNVNPRYANCLSWLYAAVGLIEMKQLTNNISISMQRGVKSTREDGKTEYKLESAFTVLENIKNTPRYWSKLKMILLAKLDNLGPFHFFFSLSSADYRCGKDLAFSINIALCFSRNHENFTSVLLDETITYKYRAGQEEVLINGMSIEEFLAANTTKHEFIRKHTHTATRNFDKRVKTFIRTIVMNSFSPLKVKEYSYRVEFQMRGNTRVYIYIFKLK